MNIHQLKEHIYIYRPTAAYLGRIQMEAMEADAAEHLRLHMATSEMKPMQPLTFYGCPIYEVNLPNHLGFAYENQLHTPLPPRL